jgi:hypothetical protein
MVTSRQRRTWALAHRESAQTLADIEVLAYLGKYYDHKIKGASELLLYQKVGGAGHKKLAIEELRAAARYWRLYRIRISAIPIQRSIIEWVDADIETAKNDPGKQD